MTEHSEEPRTPSEKVGYAVPMSFEMLLSAGAITEERAREMGWTPPAPLPRLTLVRWALRDWWSAHRPHVHLGPCDHENCV